MGNDTRFALVHDWLTGMRGGEKCLEVACELFPTAPIYTLLYVEGSVSETISSHPIVTSFAQKLPGIGKKYRQYLPLFPAAIKGLEVAPCDVVLSMSHCVAKSICAPEGATHVCYCFTPMRYVWDLFDQYFGPDRVSPVKRLALKLIAWLLQKWDARTAGRVDQFVAISRYIASRIHRHYGCEADVIYPPVNCDAFRVAEKHEDYYLVVSAFAPYKRVDLAIEAANRTGATLRIVGSGQDETRLRSLAGPTVEFLGWRSDEEIAELYARCKAFLFPGEEDFGITPLEAMASGRPVIAYGRGGALETVAPLDGDAPPTGVFFREQTVDAMCDAMRNLEKRLDDFNPSALRAHAMKFSRERFKEELKAYVMRFV